MKEKPVERLDIQNLKIEKKLLEENVKELKRLRTLFMTFVAIFVGFFNFQTGLSFILYFVANFVFNNLCRLSIGKDRINKAFGSQEQLTDGQMSDFFVS